MNSGFLCYLVSIVYLINCVYISKVYSEASTTNAEIETIVSQAEQISTEEASEFLDELAKNKCSFASSWDEEIHANVSEQTNKRADQNWNISLFMSFSIPIETWKEYSASLEKTGGIFILRGLPKNSFPLLSKNIQDLRQKGVKAPIVIDPEAFEKYAIYQVPSFVLEKDGIFDKVEGNLNLDASLTLIERYGDLSYLAKTIKQNVRQGG
ncbi:MAG: type-F conjugative transfer system pilin assembly protein TrbC [Chlamydiae bacterium]|nr:type-F conjugative transfer system pilin assembly protein TrbC [Chlamydiota bacterium]